MNSLSLLLAVAALGTSPPPDSSNEGLAQPALRPSKVRAESPPPLRVIFGAQIGGASASGSEEVSFGDSGTFLSAAWRTHELRLPQLQSHPITLWLGGTARLGGRFSPRRALTLDAELTSPLLLLLGIRVAVGANVGLSRVAEADWIRPNVGVYAAAMLGDERFSFRTAVRYRLPQTESESQTIYGREEFVLGL
ncbi:MAG: hypothetical protein AAFY60_10735 [Myxococcota bacterium]